MANILQIDWQSQLQRLEGAYAPNTLRSYYADVGEFVDWCERVGCQTFPLMDGTLVAYLAHMEQRLSFSSIRRKLSSVKRMHSLLGHGKHTHGEDFAIAYRRMRRGKTMSQRQARGINEELLLRAIAAQPNTITGIRNAALLSVGYDFLARRSELTSLQVSDINFEEGGTLRGVIRRSKTDQFGRGRLTFGSERSAKLLRRWLRRKPADIDWVFCAISHDTCIDRPICGRSVNNIIKKSVVRVKGHRPRDAEISGHSLRVGAAQDLLIKGHDTAAIMRAGGWRSLNVLSGYLNQAEHNVWS